MVAHRTHHERRKPQPTVSVQPRRPRFSVAIATRNYGRWLKRCLESVLCSYRKSGLPIQIVVANDCSSDTTSKILDHYQSNYPEIFTIVSLTTSGGISAAKNAAIRHCRGEYVALLDADDEFTPDKLTRCDQALKARPDTELLTHDYTFIDEKTGEAFVPGNEWYRSWRPPGVWVFRAGRVLFSEQMICGYEELEWSKRCWYELRRFHISEPLAIVHGERTNDRWKIDRAVAGLDGMERWDPKKKSQHPQLFSACRVCGNQYFNAPLCCDRRTERVPLVHYMTVSSFPYHAPVEFSLVVFTHDDLRATRSLCTDLLKEFKASEVEIVFVHCHPKRALLDYLCKLSKMARVKAVFAPPDQSFIYGHDVNRAARTADGRYLLMLDSRVKIERGSFRASVKLAFDNLHVDIVSASLALQTRSESNPSERRSGFGRINHSCWAIGQDSFWGAGAIAERFDKTEDALIEFQRRTQKRNRALHLQTRQNA